SAGGPFVDEPTTKHVVAAMATLRRRCPWSSRQDHRSLERYAREETEELIGALEDYTAAPTEDTRAAVVDELGDVFYQVLFHSALLDESGGHDYGHSLASVIDGLEDKLHPRPSLAVDDGDEPASLEDVEREYRGIKAEEKERTAARGKGGCR